MVHKQSRSHVYKVDWETAVHAYQLRFRSFPCRGLEELEKGDFFDFAVDGQQISFTIRGYLKPGIPAWIMKMFGHTHVKFLNRTTIDYATQTMTNLVTNEMLRHRGIMYEVNTICPLAGNPDWCVYTQQTFFELKVPMVSRKCEQICARHYQQQWLKARNVDWTYVQKLLQDKQRPQLGFVERMVLDSLQIIDFAKPSASSIEPNLQPFRADCGLPDKPKSGEQDTDHECVERAPPISLDDLDFSAAKAFAVSLDLAKCQLSATATATKQSSSASSTPQSQPDTNKSSQPAAGEATLVQA